MVSNVMRRLHYGLHIMVSNLSILDFRNCVSRDREEKVLVSWEGLIHHPSNSLFSRLQGFELRNPEAKRTHLGTDIHLHDPLILITSVADHFHHMSTYWA